ncbi:MAG: agmatinase [Sedimentisphaerales bacterium]|nr:agmatinase [Sedimentisphaerales bacterium]
MDETANFGALPSEFSRFADAEIVIVPVPFDGTSTWKKGADRGPSAIIEASANVELYDIETDSQVYLRGIFTDAPIEGEMSVDEMVAAVEQRLRRHLEDDKFPVILGGEHSVSIGAVRACAARFPGLSVLQLDAHSDLRDEYEGSKYNHACVMARLKEVCPIVQVGIRSIDVSEKPSLDPDRTFFAKDIHGRTDWIDQAATRLTERVYVTIDLDVFDPSIMPSTGTPEPGGLLWYEVLALLRAVCRQRTVVGFDVVELCPLENTWASDFLAAKLIYNVLSYRFQP